MRLIDAYELMQMALPKNEDAEFRCVPLSDIIKAPTVYSEPQKIGKWIHKGNRHTCPFCETSFTSNSAEVKNAHRYCYYCGARLE